MYSGLEENIILGDTTIGGTQYKKLYKRYIHYNTVKPPNPHPSTTTTGYENKGRMFIRYDSSENKVFYKEDVDSSEVVIYDFNLEVNDTIPLSTEYFNGNKVLRIDNIPFFGNRNRLFVLDNNYIPIRNGIIEGVGGLNGLTYNQPTFGALGGGILMTDMVCFEYGDSTYFSPWASHNQLPCPSIADFVSGIKEEFSKEDVVAIPNPNDGFFKLKIPATMIGSSLTIYNEPGSIIYSTEITQSQIDVEIDLPGLYFWHVATNTGKSYAGKILVNRF